MQLNYKDQEQSTAGTSAPPALHQSSPGALHVVVKNPVFPVVPDDGRAEALQTGIAQLAGVGVLLLLFIASVVYVALGGVLDI